MKPGDALSLLREDSQRAGGRAGLRAQGKRGNTGVTPEGERPKSLGWAGRGRGRGREQIRVGSGSGPGPCMRKVTGLCH